jgi:hypothetical protein
MRHRLPSVEKEAKMLNFTEGMATLIVGLFIVASPSLNAPIIGVGGTTAIYDSRPSVPVGSCDSLAGGGVVVRCDVPDDHAQLPSTSPSPKPAQNPGEDRESAKKAGELVAT